LDEGESNSSVASNPKNWFLLAEDGYCDEETKIRNADWAGYTVLIIRKSSPKSGKDPEGNKTVTTDKPRIPANIPDSSAENDHDLTTMNTINIDHEAKSVNIYSCTVSDADGLTLEQYTYPMA